MTLKKRDQRRVILHAGQSERIRPPPIGFVQTDPMRDQCLRCRRASRETGIDQRGIAVIIYGIAIRSRGQQQLHDGRVVVQNGELQQGIPRRSRQSQIVIARQLSLY